MSVQIKPTKYAVFHYGKVYHIACLNVSSLGDMTLCGELLHSKNGKKDFEYFETPAFAAGLSCATPSVVDHIPEGLRLCGHCEKEQVAGRDEPRKPRTQ